MHNNFFSFETKAIIVPTMVKQVFLFIRRSSHSIKWGCWQSLLCCWWCCISNIYCFSSLYALTWASVSNVRDNGIKSILINPSQSERLLTLFRHTCSHKCSKFNNNDINNYLTQGLTDQLGWPWLYESTQQHTVAEVRRCSVPWPSPPCLHHQWLPRFLAPRWSAHLADMPGKMEMDYTLYMTTLRRNMGRGGQWSQWLSA